MLPISVITTSIGTRFEDILLDNFPDFTRHKNGDNVPDLFNGNFWIEAKCGYFDFGARVKKYQLDQFRNVQEPIVHVVGYHTLQGATRVIRQKSERGRQSALVRSLGIKSAYFVSAPVIERIWDNDNTVAQKTGEAYCVLKGRFIRQIVLNETIQRKGRVLPADQYYGLNRSDFHLSLPVQSPLSFLCGWVLHKERDKPVVEYLQTRGVIPCSA